MIDLVINEFVSYETLPTVMTTEIGFIPPNWLASFMMTTDRKTERKSIRESILGNPKSETEKVGFEWLISSEIPYLTTRSNQMVGI